MDVNRAKKKFASFSHFFLTGNTFLGRAYDSVVTVLAGNLASGLALDRNKLHYTVHKLGQIGHSINILRFRM